MAEAVVVGGGIGGLAAAVALHRSGWRVTVLERAAEFTEIGAGLALWPNAMRALTVLGLAGRVRDFAGVETVGGVRDRAGRRLSRTDNADVERRHGWPLLMVHRAELVRALVAALPPESLRAGCEVRLVRPDGVVEHRGGTVRGDLVVAADGVRSLVRRQCWPEASGPRYAGCTAWRAVTEPLDRGAEGALFWGRGERIGFAALPGGRFYCFAAARVPEGGAEDPYTGMIRRFGDWPGPVPELLAAVPAGAVLRHDVYAVPPPASYVRGRVALLGDAAHAMEPTLGQGAGTALEDAVTLAACLRGPDIDRALARYDRWRRPRTKAIARRSALLGAVGLARSAAAAWARDHAARLIPPALVLRSMDSVLGWTPPTPGQADLRDPPDRGDTPPPEQPSSQTGAWPSGESSPPRGVGPSGLGCARASGERSGPRDAGSSGPRGVEPSGLGCARASGEGSGLRDAGASGESARQGCARPASKSSGWTDARASGGRSGRWGPGRSGG